MHAYIEAGEETLAVLGKDEQEQFDQDLMDLKEQARMGSVAHLCACHVYMYVCFQARCFHAGADGSHCMSMS